MSIFGAYPLRVALFVDAANLYYVKRALGIEIDFIRLRQFFETRNSFLAYAGYYTAIDEDEAGNRQLQPLVDMLSYHGWTVVSKPTKSYTNPTTNIRKVKGNMDVEFTIDVLRLCEHVDRVILVTGDGDFTALASAVQMKGRQVSVVSSRRANMLSSDLRRVANQVIDLADIVEHVRAL